MSLVRSLCLLIFFMGGSLQALGGDEPPVQTPPPAEAMRNAINDQRLLRGLPALEPLSGCEGEAQFHAEDMAAHRYFSHDSPTETWQQRFSRFGLSGRIGENIAKSYSSSTTLTAIVNMWMNSPGHRANILKRSYHSTGVGYAIGRSGTVYWVQCFSDDQAP